jgi:next-to-BRCA1 protein 1
MDSGSAEIHNPFHQFFDIEEPGRVIVHTVFSGNGEMDASSSAARSSTNAERNTQHTPAPTLVPVTHNAFCDLCDSKIIGERYVSCFHLQGV